MKSSVAIILIVCGTGLVAVPYIHNTIIMKQVTDTMVALDRTVNLTANMPRHADTVCMFSGIFMILAGAVMGLISSKSNGPSGGTQG